MEQFQEQTQDDGGNGDHDVGSPVSKGNPFVFLCANVLGRIGGKGISDGGHGNYAEGFNPHAGRKSGQDLCAKAVYH